MPIEYQGDEEAIASVKEHFLSCAGAFGHLLGNERTTPIDLAAALMKARSAELKPFRVSGGELVAKLDPGPLPPGSMT